MLGGPARIRGRAAARRLGAWPDQGRLALLYRPCQQEDLVARCVGKLPQLLSPSSMVQRVFLFFSSPPLKLKVCSIFSDCLHFLLIFFLFLSFPHLAPQIPAPVAPITALPPSSALATSSSSSSSHNSSSSSSSPRDQVSTRATACRWARWRRCGRALP